MVSILVQSTGGRCAAMKAALLAVAIGAQVSAGFVPAPARCGLLVVAPRADAACIPGRARALDDRVGARRSASADRFRHALWRSLAAYLAAHPQAGCDASEPSPPSGGGIAASAE